MIEQLRRQLQTAQNEIDTLTTRMSHSIQTENHSSMVSNDFEIGISASSGVGRTGSVESKPNSVKKVECATKPSALALSASVDSYGDDGFGESIM